MPDTPTANELGDLFGFTPDELALNRRGDLSARQRQLVRYRSIGYIVRGIGVLVLGVILTLSIDPFVNSPVEAGAYSLAQFALAGIALVWLYAAYRVAFPTIERTTGPLRRTGTARHPRIRIGGVELRISYRHWNHLAGIDHTRTYRAYFGPEMTLFSLEPIESGEES